MMRKLYHQFQLSSLALGALLLTASCDDYLSIVPKGEKIPTTLADYSAMLLDEYGCQRTDATQAIVLMNDRQLSAYYLNDEQSLYRANYYWDETADRIALNKSDEASYYVPYSAISTCNLLIENVPQATEGTTAEKASTIAQARLLRAMSYFDLVNFYADTYTEATAQQKGGVPVITSANINAPHTQLSVQGVYDFILDDMKAAYNDLPEQGATILNPNHATADAFYARLYLQMGRYKDALAYAEKALAANSTLFDYVAFYDQNHDVIEDAANFSVKIPTPMGFDYVENYNFRHGSISNYASSENNLTLWRAARFEEGDARFAARWKHYTAGSETYYRSCMTGYYNYGGMTTVEMYLIKAECQARANLVDDAMTTLNKVRATRILPEHYTELSAANESEAIRQIIAVKANELILTQVPFNDARRLNAEGKVLIEWTKTEGEKSYTLKADSHLWTMPFPQGAIKNPGNGNITQNVEQ